MIPEPYPVNYMSNRDGVFFLDAPIPPKRHRCKVQTMVQTYNLTVRRCACGARRLGVLGFWHSKNSRTEETS